MSLEQQDEFQAIADKLWSNYVENARKTGVRNVGSLQVKNNILQIKTKIFNILTKISLATYHNEWKTNTDFNGKETYILKLEQFDIEIYQNVNIYIITLYSKELIEYEGLEHKYLKGVLALIKEHLL